jgi:CheY-like chemotaxis protein
VPDEKTPIILLVEDDPDMAFLFCRIFRRLLPGWDICHVSDGLEAIGRLKEGLHPTALITDLEMPKMDGFALIEWTRGDPEYRSIPIVAFSNPRIRMCLGVAGSWGLISLSSKPPALLMKPFAPSSRVLIKQIYKSRI